MNGIKQGPVSITVGIVSNNCLLQLGLQRILETERRLRFIGQATSATCLEDLFTDGGPQVLIVDVEPSIDVTRLIRRVKAAATFTKIILLTDLDDKERIKEAFSLGVNGIVLKVQPPAVLVAAIESLASSMGAGLHTPGNGTVNSLNGATPPSVSPDTDTDTDPCQMKWLAALTEREREVVVLIGQGLSNKDIADRLCISVITVRHHLTSIFDKLGVNSRQKLLVRVHQYGLVEFTASA